MSPTTGTVFLSYASEDSEAAQRIADALKKVGIQVWFDRSELRGGEVWDREIRTHIYECRLFIPIVSSTTEARIEGYFRREWKLAVERTHDLSERAAFIVPVVIDDTSELTADVPEDFRAVQWMRLAGGAPNPAFTARLSALLAPDQGKPPQQRSRKVAPAISPRRGHSSRLARMAITATAVAIALGGAYIALRRESHVGAPEPARVAGRPADTNQWVPPEKSIAVLPFVDLSEKHDEGYFADGLAEELIDLLTKVPNLSVVARTSSFHFKEKSVPVLEIGKALNVAYVLEGSVRQAGVRFRITSQLIRTDSERHVWSATYDRPMQDIFKIQDEITGEVIQALRIALASSSRIRSTSTAWNAYQTYLQGLFADCCGTKDGLDRATAAFRDALAIDETFAPAWAELASSLAEQSDSFGTDPTKTYSEARYAAQRALALDSALVRAYVVMASIHANYDWDWNGAERVAARAAQLEPGNSQALGELSFVALTQGDWARATDLAHRALARDPLKPTAHDALGAALYCKGEFDESAAEYRRSLELHPAGGVTQALLSRSLMLQGQLQEALQVAGQDPVDSFRLWATAMVQHAMGREAESNRTLAEHKKRFPGSPDGTAWIYAAQGRLDEAFDWFEKAYQRRNNGLIFLKCMPEAPAFTHDPRYQDLLRQMKLPE